MTAMMEMDDMKKWKKIICAVETRWIYLKIIGNWKRSFSSRQSGEKVSILIKDFMNFSILVSVKLFKIELTDIFYSTTSRSRM